MLPSVLGVDGYNPSAIQYDTNTSDSASTSHAVKKADQPSTGGVSPEVLVDRAIQLILKYRSGGDGGNALKLLITFVKNIVENPQEVK